MTTIFVDFDGTVTEHDLLDRIAQTFGDPRVYAEVDAGLDQSRLTLHEVLRREFEPVRAPLPEVVDWVLAHASLRPGFRELVELARERGWRLVVLSSGFHETIEPVLRREGVEARVVANHVAADAAGWRAEFAPGATCEVCGERCKRAAVGGLGPFAYVGDGVSDRCVSLAAERRFARDGLARWLDREGVPYESFGDLHDVLAALARPD